MAASSRGGGAADLPGPALYALALAGFLLLGLWIYRPALSGEFLSDDHFVIVANPYVHELSPETAAAILDPWGAPAALTINYAPVHLLLHAAEWQTFGRESTVGWHLVNVGAHVLATLAMVALFRRLGLGRGAALGAGALFLVHPANVEAVAWIFELKTPVAVGLALGAVALHATRPPRPPRPPRPGWGLALFSAALLTKFSAVFALPAAAALTWVRRAPGWGWLACWLVVILGVGVAQVAAFHQATDPGVGGLEDPVTRVATSLALVPRYLALAAGVGLATFHSPPPVRSLLDPLALTGLLVVVLLGARTLWALRERREEAVCWLLAAGAFAPVSQLAVPFQHPLADRYLYAILPGLLGGILLAARPAFGWLARRTAPLPAAGAALAVTALLVVALAVRAEERASVFRDNRVMLMDAARRYPQGLQAQLLRARDAARRGDASAAAAAMDRAVDLHHTDLNGLLLDPAFAGVRGHPAFQRVLARLARRHVEQLAPRDSLHAFQRIGLAIAYNFLDRRAEARAALAPALDETGPFQEVARELDAALRRQEAGHSR